MKHEVTTTEMKQPGNEIMNRKDKTLYYLIIGEKEEKVVINIGLKTYEAIEKLNNKKGGKQ